MRRTTAPHQPHHPTAGPIRPTAIAAVLAVLATLVAVLGLSPAAPAGAVDDPVEHTVVGGALDWGIRQSFREYIVNPNLAKGTITLEDGATRNEDGTFHFESDDSGTATGTTTVDAPFAGSVHFEGHDGKLDIRVADPRLVIDGTVGHIVADVTSRAFTGTNPEEPPGDETFYDDVALVALDLAAAPPATTATSITWTNVPAKLTSAGVDAFGEFYRVDAVFDPVTVTLDIEEPTEWDPQVIVSKTTGIAAAGETITVTGTGFDPEANPALADQAIDEDAAGGVYVAFGRFATEWRPSQNAPAASRNLLATRWALPAASLATADDPEAPIYAELEDDGSFEVTLAVAPDDTVTGSYGVVTYAGGGRTNASQETLTPVAFAAPVDPDPDPVDPTEPTDVTGGSMSWGVRQSFRTYITGPIANGTITLADGATTLPDGRFSFPAIPSGTDSPTGTVDVDGDSEVAFGGTVVFRGHDDLLQLTITALRVDFTNGGAGELVADVTSKSFEGTTDNPQPGQSQTFDDVVLGALDLADVAPQGITGGATWVDIPATLTEAGAPAFGTFYAAGSALDPVTLALQLADVPDLPPAPVPSTPTATIDRTTVAAGGTMTVSGAGFTAGEQVQVFLHSTPVFLTIATANATGTVSQSVTIPTATAAGTHRLELRGVSSGRSLFSPEFQVTAAPSTNPLARTGLDLAPTAGTGLLLLGLGAGALAIVTNRRRALR